MVHVLLGAFVALAVSDGLPVNTPKSVGMSAARLASIDRIVMRGINAGGYPGASVVIGRNGYAVYQKGFGKLGWTTSSGCGRISTTGTASSSRRGPSSTTSMFCGQPGSRLLR